MRLLSYNTHKGIGVDRRYDLERVLAVAESVEPDLLCLQEVDFGVARSRFEDQPAAWAARFPGFSGVFQHNVRVQAGGYGNMLLSRWPLVEVHPVSLRRGRRKNRGAQIVLVAAPGGELVVVNLHLSLTEGTRRWQVERLLGHSFLHRHRGTACLVAGDTNDWRGILGRRVFERHGFRPLGRWARTRSFPSFLPLGRLDRAFARGPLVVGRVHAVRGPLARLASDHLPLVVEGALSLGRVGGAAVESHPGSIRMSGEV